MKITPELVEIIIELHVLFDDYKKISAWLQTENYNFGGVTPIQLINRGRGKKVYEFIRYAQYEAEI